MYDKVGRLQVLDKWKQDGRDYALTLCDCGNKKAIRYDYLQKCVKENLEASCGCRQKEVVRDLGFKNKRFNFSNTTSVYLVMYSSGASGNTIVNGARIRATRIA